MSPKEMLMKPDGHGTSRYITPSARRLLSYSKPLALLQKCREKYIYIYIFKGTSPPISLDFYHFAATFGNFHNIESSSTQAGTSISRLRIQVLLPRHERHRAAVLAAKWRRLASVPLGSGPAVHRIDDMEKKHLFVPFNST